MKTIKAKTLKEKPDFTTQEFGKTLTDHMFVMHYADGKWDEGTIKPVEDFNLSPAALVFHYGQTLFEGCKAYKNEKGEISMFRTDSNLERLNKTAERMGMAQVDVDVALEGIKALVKLDQEWIPTGANQSLYVRPTMFACEPSLSPRASKEYYFFVVMSPVGTLYHNAEGEMPAIYIEDTMARAVVGGTGEAKCGGNYAATFKVYEKAKKNGYGDILWLDAKEKKYIEEVGSMNFMFVEEGKVVTPSLTGSILRGITRDSILKMLAHQNFPCEERRITVDELFEKIADGRITEAFGVGTAGVVSPIGKLTYKDRSVEINGRKTGPVAKMIKENLVGIQTKQKADPFGWVIDIK